VNNRQRNVVQLAVKNRRIEEPVVIDGWWQRLFKKILNCFQKESHEHEVADELQALRERKRDYRTVVRCATLILNRQYDDELTDKKGDTE
jgi:hypothetical protein